MPASPYLKMKPLIEKETLLPGNNSYKKNLQKIETVINTCVSLIKRHWKKMIEIPQRHVFLTWSIQNFVRKVPQFVRKCYITRLIDL